MNDLSGVLRTLYDRQIALLPDEQYLRIHNESSFLNGTIRVFRFYVPYLPATGRILDWSCRHAPDACLLRKTLGPGIVLDGCDTFDPGAYAVFYDYSGLRYERLHDCVRLPYADAAFDAVVASGVLEHVPMDYESLKELYRVLKPGGRLIVTYLPNAASIEEWRERLRRGRFHPRLYRRAGLESLLLHTGFRPLVTGFQTRLDLLPGGDSPVDGLRPVLRCLMLHRLTACLCAVAEKVKSF